MAQVADAANIDTWEKALFLFLGWLLATLSPIIADTVRRRRELRELKPALLAELRELKFRLALAAYHIEMRFGNIDRKYLQWLRPVVAGYTGPNPAERILKSIDAQLSASDEVIAALAEKERASGEGGLNLKKYLVPLSDAKIGAISWLPDDVQTLILEIRTQMRMLDDEIDQSRFYFQLTFDSGVIGANRESVNGNLTASYRHYRDRARIIVDTIQTLERRWA